MHKLNLMACYFLGLILISIHTYAQDANEIQKQKTDSIIMSYRRAAAMRNPLARQGGISKEIVGRENVTSDLYGNKLSESDVRISRIRANFNLPIMIKGKNAISASVNLLQQRLDLSNTQSFNPQFPVRDMTIDKSTITVSGNYTRFDSLFNKPVIVSASIAGMTDQLVSTLRLNLITLAAIQLKRTPVTAYSVGLLILIDPSAPTPFIPYFSYWHKFNNDLELFLDLPTKLAVRKQVTKRAAVLLSSEISGTSAFFDLKDSALPRKDLYATLELKTGPTFEYLVSKNIILGVNGGLLSTLNSRMYERSASSNDYFIKNKMGSTPYVNFSISILPFLKGFKL